MKWNFILFQVTLYWMIGMAGKSQTITVQGIVTLEILEDSIENQTDFHLSYIDEAVTMFGSKQVNYYKEPLEIILKEIFQPTPLTYQLLGKTIIIRRKNEQELEALQPAYNGIVMNAEFEKLQSVTVSAPLSGKMVATKADGSFTIKSSRDSILVFSYVGYETVYMKPERGSSLTVIMNKLVGDLDETVVIGYGNTSRRYNTGSVASVKAAAIENQPVNNPLLTLQGRVPGLIITQSSGHPGGGIKIQLRGQSSIGRVPGTLPANDPLIVINGMPYAPNNESLEVIGSGSVLSAGGRSPFSNIFLDDIESIEVLKDADATAIYGSRGANGVILITTKKGEAGKLQFKGNIYTGFSKITRVPDMMNTSDYVKMRLEALQNDGLVPDIDNAPELVGWDTTRYTNFKDLLLGGTANMTHANLGITGGSKQTQFYVSGSYRKETSVFPGNLSDTRGNIYANLRSATANKKLEIEMTANYSTDNNNLIVHDLTRDLKLPPHAPNLIDENGILKWSENNVSFSNPLAYLLQPYEARTYNFIGNLQLSYRLTNHIKLKSHIGYNSLYSTEKSQIPYLSRNPVINPKGSAYYGENNYRSWTVEPQIEYFSKLFDNNLNVLIGGTWLSLSNKSPSYAATGFPAGTDLNDISKAGNVTRFNEAFLYRYIGLFARINYNIKNKYILNITGRRDGSSRFGPDRQFGNFGAVAGAWLFSNETFCKEHLPLLSFGKLRASYGITGNDQIDNYQYLDRWNGARANYLGDTGYIPTSLPDRTYSWEVNRKLEIAVELGFWKDKAIISVSWYRSRSGNQIIGYTLPVLTGFNNIAATNFPALVQNTGLEISASFKKSNKKGFQYSFNLNLTLPKNKLLAFPELEISSYRDYLIIGESLSVQRGYKYTGVDPATGLFTFEDLNGDGEIKHNDDFKKICDLDPELFGGFQGNFRYKNWSLNFLIEYNKQSGRNILFEVYKDDFSEFPGYSITNEPVLVNDRWQHPGDISNIQKLTAKLGTSPHKAISLFRQSSAIISDASYARLKNISLYYSFSKNILKELKCRQVDIYLSAQNFLIITPYEDLDPETANLSVLPPLKTISLGLKLVF